MSRRQLAPPLRYQTPQELLMQEIRGRTWRETLKRTPGGMPEPKVHLCEFNTFFFVKKDNRSIRIRSAKGRNWVEGFGKVGYGRRRRESIRAGGTWEEENCWWLLIVRQTMLRKKQKNSEMSLNRSIWHIFGQICSIFALNFG